MMPAPNTLKGPCRGAASGTVRQVVILLHGYGADGQDLIGLAPYFARALPDAAFYAPDGPSPYEMAPFGRQWFSLTVHDSAESRRHPESLARGLECLADGADEATPALRGFIDTVCARYGLGYEHVALVGFSQGTMMALHVGLRFTPRLAGIAGFSGALVGASRLAADSPDDPPPVLLVHGEQDPVLPFSAMALAEKALTKAGIPNDTLGRPGLEHAIDDVGIARAMTFLKTVFDS